MIAKYISKNKDDITILVVLIFMFIRYKTEVTKHISISNEIVKTTKDTGNGEFFPLNMAKM